MTDVLLSLGKHGCLLEPFSYEPAAPRAIRPIRAVLFDRDGVLTYFNTGAAAEYFRPLLPISIFALAGRWQAAGAEQGLRSLADERSFSLRFWNALADEFALDAAQRAKLLAVDYAQFIVPFPEVRATLATLRRSNLRLGVLSNFSLVNLDHSLASIGLGDFFDVVCAAPVIGVAKPDPRAYQIALAALQVQPQECLFFDDEPQCVEGAQRIGLRAYLVDRRATATDLHLRMVNDLSAVPQLAWPA